MSSSQYCMWGLCDSQEYCCGDNVCCKEAKFNILFLMTIIFGTIAIMALCCTYFCYNSLRVYDTFLKRYFKITYFSMKEDNEMGSIMNQKPTAGNHVVQI